MRRRLPPDRRSVTRTLRLGDSTFHLVVGLYEDGTVGELMVFGRTMGTEMHALLDALLMSVSIGLQYGVPLGEYVSKLRGIRFPPEGLTKDPVFRTAASMLDLVAQYLQQSFMN